MSNQAGLFEDTQTASTQVLSDKASRSNTVGKIVLAATGALAVGLVAVTTPFITPALRKVCLPYVPATDKQIVNVLKMCRARTNAETSMKLADLGSGDGRVVFAAARQGYKASGYELNYWLVWYSRLKARLQGVHRKATFTRADLWKVDLSSYDKIVIFGVSEMMQGLEDKLKTDMKDGAQVVACRFPLPSWKPCGQIEEGIDSVWLYRKQ